MPASAKAAAATKRPQSAPPTRSRALRGTASEGDTQRTLRRWRDVVPNDRLAHLVKDAMRAFDRALQMRLAEHAVSIGHWPFLRILWESDGLTQRELSHEAGVMEPTTFAALKAMEQRGYVVRRKIADDRRKVHIFLTAAGRALERRLVPLAVDVNRIAVRGMSAADVAGTRRMLLAVLENLARDEHDDDGNGRRMPSTRERGRLANPAGNGDGSGTGRAVAARATTRRRT